MDTVVAHRMIMGQGTPELEWQQWLTSHQLASTNIDDLVHSEGCVHIIAPHPDDEVLGCAGIIQQLAQRNIPVKIWAVTDGEHSHDETPQRSRADLSEIRTQESLRALALLYTDVERIRLRISDGEVAQAETELCKRFSEQFRLGDTVIAPWLLDGHPDHEAASRAARNAAQQQHCRFYEVPIWGWHWASPDAKIFPIQRAIRIELSQEEQACKAAAIGVFQSQLHPDLQSGKPEVLPNCVLARFYRCYEILLG